MGWRVDFTDKARQQLRKLHPDVQSRLLRFLRERVASSDDPRMLASRLTGELAAYWRFRVGDYRLLCRVDDGTLTVLVISLGHRKQVYQRSH
jgi:mRNA interferase RelE/StbE